MKINLFKNNWLNAIISGSISFIIGFGIFSVLVWAMTKQDIFSLISGQVELAKLNSDSTGLKIILDMILPVFIVSLIFSWIGIVYSYKRVGELT